ncbi:glycosyltransferase family 4 protein [Nocardioides coralli]|uniref:glycosyltransferase family 4 protein n=1 Tax=Nocardioides coralli TaxID=2872154 RepID=UPI001CA40610|nr:glycosyltransferase family 4 protein [Nocardioides coralli]QZY30050.1 glycosyltransferase family 4 protein [Nocardioides coralli]
MAQRVHLHVGTPKSGTTYLQAALWANRTELAARGLLYPGRRPFDQNRASMDGRQGRLDPDHSPAPRVWPRIRSEVAAYDGSAVLSNEWWVAASEEHARAAVDSLGGPDRVHVVVSTRSLVRLVPAAWQESLKVGRGHALGDFVRGLDDPGNKWSWDVVDPARVAGAWARVVGPDHVRVVTVPEAPTTGDLLWQRFAASVDVDVAGLEVPARTANESLSVQAARLLQDYGPALREEVDALTTGTASWRARARWLRNTVVRRALVDVPGDPIGVDDALLTELRDRGEASVSRLRDLGCQVVGDLSDLLDGTNRSGSRHPDDVSAAELVEAGRVLAVGLLRDRIEAGDSAARTDDPDGPGDPDDTGDTEEAAPDPAEGTLRRFTFLVPSAYAPGGIARVVSTVANELVRRGCEVSVITLVRPTAEPYFHFDPAVRLLPLQDRYDPARPHRQRPRARNDRHADERVRQLDSQPSALADGARKTFTAYVDLLLQECLESMPPGVFVSTRPEFAVAASRWAAPGSVLLHQEHLSFVPRPVHLREALRDTVLGRDGTRALDAFLTLTDADLERWVEFLGPTAVRTDVIPNPIPFTIGEPAPLTSKVVVAAGRLTMQKGFERLISAWAPLVGTHPDWRLDIYGEGGLHDDLAAQIADLGLGDRVRLAGVTPEFEARLAEASIYAMSSRFEGLPMVLLEACSKGVPPVSFDCPEGPRQLIEDGVNGLLVPEGDIPALTDGLRRLMDDAALRRRLGAGALETARNYQVEAVADRWLELVDEVAPRPAVT